MKTRPVGMIASLNQISRRGRLRTPEGSCSFWVTNGYLYYGQSYIEVSRLRVLREGGVARFRVREMMQDDQILQIIEEDRRQNLEYPYTATEISFRQQILEWMMGLMQTKLFGIVNTFNPNTRRGTIKLGETLLKINEGLLAFRISKVGNLVILPEESTVITREEIRVERRGNQVPFDRGLKVGDKILQFLEQSHPEPVKKSGQKRILTPLPQRAVYEPLQGRIIIAKREGRISRWL